MGRVGFALFHSWPPLRPLTFPMMAAVKGTQVNGLSRANGAVVDNGLYHASTSAAPLSAADAVAHLATYKTGDGLSMSELIDSRTHGGLTYNGRLAC